MLPARHRMRSRADFDVAFTGRRAGSRTVLVAAHTSPDRSGSGTAVLAPPPSVGFVVSRAVGGAVHRNRVKRRLRHAVAAYVSDLPPGARVVVRALPEASSASSAQLAKDVGRALARVGCVTGGAAAGRAP